jgi:N-glycosylase/DNA lyase
MTLAKIMEWKRLPVAMTELCLATTLRCGQSFRCVVHRALSPPQIRWPVCSGGSRWRKSEDGIWSMALHGRILALCQDSTHLYYHSVFPTAMEAPLTPPSSIPPSTADEPNNDDDTAFLVKHYLNLEPDLAALYSQWSGADPNFRKKAPKFAGVRILRQDAWEALIGFICSSNNNIIRISQMVDKLCLHYGPLVGHLDGAPYHDFPLPSALTGKNVEGHLRELGFGYRAKYIHRTAVIVANERLPGWLESLRNPESPVLGTKASPAGKLTPEGRDAYRAAHEALLQLQGVGPKVADCVCLMGLGWGEAVPVDTHVWQIAQRDYRFGKGKHSSLTKTTYEAIANHFRKLWGKEAGWAHSVLFTADLKAFSERLAAKVEIKEEATNDSTELSPVVVKAALRKITVKREHEDDKPIVKLEEVVTTTGERVKRRRRG